MKIRTAPVAAIGVVVLLSAVSGCGSKPKCDKTQRYQDSTSVPPIEVPEGFEAPNTSEALVVPNVSSSTASNTSSSPCLDSPPQFFEESGWVAGSPEAMVGAWADAWAAQNFEVLMTFYAPSFKPPDNQSDEEWRENRQRQLLSPTALQVAVSDMSVSSAGPDRRRVVFSQNLAGTRLRTEMILERYKGNWRITSEQVIDVL